MKKNGFTLVEIVVVMAIVSVLATLAVGGIIIARRMATDTRRINDLRTIQTALQSYKGKHGDWMEVGSGAGWNGDGQGWFNISGGSYPKSIAQNLIDEGILQTEVIDPTGGRSTTPTTGYAYMKYTCTINGTRGAYIYAKLEGREQSDTATDGTCCSTCDTSYGMNFYVVAQ